MLGSQKRAGPSSDESIIKKQRVEEDGSPCEEMHSTFEDDLAFLQAAEAEDQREKQLAEQQKVKSSQEARWGRPAVPAIDPETTPIIFQQLELDHYLSDPLPGMPGAQTGTVPILRMFGVRHSLSHSPTFLLTHSPTFSLTHSLTHSLTFTPSLFPGH